jgi:acyl-CoA thioester hydrolase
MPPFRFSIRVYYEDTDAGGVVYYANYLRFMERARTEWLRSLGFEQDELAREAGVLFAVNRAEVDYLKPARFNDRLLVVSEIAELGKARIGFAQEVRRAADDVLLCRGLVRVVCVDGARFRPTAIPQAIRDRLTAEGTTQA